MIKTLSKYLICVMLMLAGSVSSQSLATSRFDSISEKSYEYLKGRFEETLNDRHKSKIYVTAWLQKAKSDSDNYFQLAMAYRNYIVFAEKKQQLKYADSMIVNAVSHGNHELIGSSYMAKGIIHYNRNEHIKALDSYLIADRYIIQNESPVVSFQLKYGIAQIKYYLGFYNEAIALFRECVSYYEKENDRAYLNSLHGLALCYTRIEKYDLASQTNILGIRCSKDFEVTGMVVYFNHSEGINQYFRGNYNQSMKLLTSSLPSIIKLKDFANEAVAYFYLGKCSKALKHYDKAIKYFKKVDGIFQKEKYILPDLRQGYEYLIDYYKQSGNTTLQLFYINQLLKVDKILAEDYKYLLKKIVKEYDTKELLSAKNAIENKMVFTRIVAGVVVLLMAIVIIYLIVKNRRNQKRFEELMQRNTSLPEEIVEYNSEIEEQQSSESENGKNSSPDISPDIEAAILKRLEKFELNKKYLEKEMNLSKMAIILHTNSKYVTKIVAKHRGKGTIEYITELKLNYIIEMLKTESRYRNYTNQALGEEAGFRTTQNFTRAFTSYTGITPTYFSSKLKRAAATDNSV